MYPNPVELTVCWLCLSVTPIKGVRQDNTSLLLAQSVPYWCPRWALVPCLFFLSLPLPRPCAQVLTRF